MTDEDKEVFGWLEHAASIESYKDVAAVTSEEAAKAVDRLFNNTETNRALRWYVLVDKFSVYS